MTSLNLMETSHGVLLVESLASLHDARHGVPKLVPNVSNHAAKGRATRILRTVSSSLYAGLVPSTDLPYCPMITFWARWRAYHEDADLLVTNVLQIERDGAVPTEHTAQADISPQHVGTGCHAHMYKFGVVRVTKLGAPLQDRSQLRRIGDKNS